MTTAGWVSMVIILALVWGGFVAAVAWGMSRERRKAAGEPGRNGPATPEGGG